MVVPEKTIYNFQQLFQLILQCDYPALFPDGYAARYLKANLAKKVERKNYFLDWKDLRSGDQFQLRTTTTRKNSLFLLTWYDAVIPHKEVSITAKE